MADVKVPVQLPDGKMGEGIEVPVLEATERWSDVTLTDGTVLRVKLSLAVAIRIDGHYDAEGNPLYFAKGTPVTGIVRLGDNLKAKGN